MYFGLVQKLSDLTAYFLNRALSTASRDWITFPWVLSHTPGQGLFYKFRSLEVKVIFQFYKQRFNRQSTYLQRLHSKYQSDFILSVDLLFYVNDSARRKSQIDTNISKNQIQIRWLLQDFGAGDHIRGWPRRGPGIRPRMLENFRKFSNFLKKIGNINY